MLIPLGAAREQVELIPLHHPRVVHLPPQLASGRLAADTMRAGRPLPERDLSAMDGYALRLGARSATGPFRLRTSAVMGRPSDRSSLRAGEAVYVGTGAPLPRGANAVARIEATRVAAGRLRLRHPAKTGQDILRSGESVRARDRVLERGRPIRPVDVGALIALRTRKVPVFEIRAAVLPIGDELAGSPNGPANGVPEYLGPVVAGLLGFCAVDLQRPLPDDRTEVARALRRVARGYDLVITTGGSSVGAKDVTKIALGDVGRLLFEGVTTNVLKRGAVGIVDGTPVVVLPGQIVSAVTVFHEHVLHLLSRMVGRELRAFEETTLDEDVAVRHRMDTTYLFRLSGGKANPLPWGVARITALLRADAFGLLQRGREYHAGETIRVQRLWHLA